MRKRDFYGKDISFDSDRDRELFEDEVFLKTDEWRPSPGQCIASGTFRTIREAFLENLQTGEKLQVLQKKVHHPLSKRLPILEAFRWWKLRKIGSPVVPFLKLDPQTLYEYVTDLRTGSDHRKDSSKVFDTNAPAVFLQELHELFEEKPLKNPQEVVEQVRGILAHLKLNGLSAHTDEVFLMVVRERDSFMRIVLGDLKMINLDGDPEENVYTENAILRFLSRFGVVA